MGRSLAYSLTRQRPIRVLTCTLVYIDVPTESMALEESYHQSIGLYYIECTFLLNDFDFDKSYTGFN